MTRGMETKVFIVSSMQTSYNGFDFITLALNDKPRYDFYGLEMESTKKQCFSLFWKISLLNY